MSMSRKDYELIAAALQRTHTLIEQTPANQFIDAERHVAVEVVARFLADALAEDNARFDRERFIAATKPEPPKPVTYKITRFFQGKQGKVIATGYTLEQAQAHCNDESTHGQDWFDGYDEE